MERKKFRQNLVAEDLIAFNFYLVDRKSKTTLFPRILGLFIFILGCIDIAKEGANIPLNLITMAIGVFGMLGLVPLSSYMQKRAIRKKLTAANSVVPMDVTIYEEGIRFELPTEDTVNEAYNEIAVEQVEEETPVEKTELSDNELRELEYAKDEVVKEVVEETEAEVVEEETEEVEIIEEPTEPEVAKVEGEREFHKQQQEQAPSNAFTIPWGGMSNVEETNEYIFVNVAGYQTMIIRKDACDTIDEVIQYIKDNLKDVKRYTTNFKKDVK